MVGVSSENVVAFVGCMVLEMVFVLELVCSSNVWIPSHHTFDCREMSVEL